MTTLAARAGAGAGAEATTGAGAEATAGETASAPGDALAVAGRTKSASLPPAGAASRAGLAGPAVRRSRAWRSGLFRWSLRCFGLAYVGLLVAVPVGWVAWRALSPGIGAALDTVTSSQALHALALSAEVAAIAVTANTVFGVGVALVLARHRFRGASLLEALIDLPLSLSPIVVGLALTVFWSGTEGWARGVVGRLGIEVLFAVPAIVLASAFVSLPYVAREVLPVLQEIGTEQEQAAETLGAGRWYVFRRITLPAIRWGLVYGVVLTTARVLGEYGAVLVVSGNVVGRTQTLTLFVNQLFGNYDEAGAYAVALELALVSMCLLGLLSLIRRRAQRT